MASTARRAYDAPAKAPAACDDRFSPATRRRLSGPGLRSFAAICEAWGLDEAQRRLLLGSPSRSTYQNWMRTAREGRPVTLGVDELTRVSAVLGIHKALRILHADAAAENSWLRGPHAATVFGGASPLALMTGGPLDAILTVRRFLDAARGGLYMAPNGADEVPPATDADIVFA